MARIVALLSGNGGVGKTISAIGLAKAAVRMGRSALLLEINVRTADVYLGLTNRIIYDIADVLSGACAPRQAVINCGFMLLPGFSGKMPVLRAETLRELLIDLKSEFDYVFIDLPTGVFDGANVVCALADECIIVEKRGLLMERGIMRMADFLSDIGRAPRAIITGAKARDIPKLPLSVIGIVPRVHNPLNEREAYEQALNKCINKEHG